MIIMPSNNTSQIVRHLFKRFPDKIALLLNPRSITPHQLKFRHALDNDCFVQFNEKKFFECLKRLKNPIFVVCPDVVGCHDRTYALWQHYYPKIKLYKYPIAFVAQDGCKPEFVPKKADWIFIGGKDPWKMNNVHKFIGNRPVHVGRVNGIKRLKYCESLGVASVDGTGWMRARDKKFYDLMEYFYEVKQCTLL
jgi:hypothetical protein